MPFRHFWHETHKSKSHAVRQQSPKWARYKCDKLISEAQAPDRIPNAVFLADEICDDEGDRGIQENKKGNGKRADTK